MELLWTILFGFILTLIFKAWLQRRSDSRKKLPPGPWGLPVLGHLPFFGNYPPKAFLRWSQKYGPVCLIQAGSFRTVILNDAKTIKEAFALPSLGGRPALLPYTKATERKGILFCNYDADREQRQFMSKSLKNFGLRGSLVEERISREISELVEILGRDVGQPLQIHELFNSSVVNTINSYLLSHRFEEGDPVFTELLSLTSRIAKVPGFLTVMGLFMSWLGESFPRFTQVDEIENSYRDTIKFAQARIEERRDSRVPGEPRDVTDAYLDQVDACADENSTFHPKHKFQAVATADLFFASGDTVSASLEWTILLLATFQDVQKKLQEEIESVISLAEEPVLRHRSNMPYAEAVIHEIFRFTSVAPFGVAHLAEEDMEFHGYLIPKDTMIMQNIWGAHHDQAVWGDPDNFRPERFLDEEGKFKRSENFIVFGSGKRVCLGENLARDQMFLFVTNIFRKFHLTFASEKPSPKLEGKFSFVLHPQPFFAVFNER